MLKLIICLVCTLATAVMLLQLRQQRLELQYDSGRLHDQIKSTQARLWDQQLQIAVFTAPNAIARTVGTHDLKMHSPTPLPPAQADWIGATPASTPD